MGGGVRRRGSSSAAAGDAARRVDKMPSNRTIHLAQFNRFVLMTRATCRVEGRALSTERGSFL